MVRDRTISFSSCVFSAEAMTVQMLDNGQFSFEPKCSSCFGGDELATRRNDRLARKDGGLKAEGRIKGARRIFVCAIYSHFQALSTFCGWSFFHCGCLRAPSVLFLRHYPSEKAFGFLLVHDSVGS